VVIDRSPRRRLRLRPYPGERAVLSTVAVDGGGVRLTGLDIKGTVELLPGASQVALVGNRWTTDGRSGNTNLSMGPGVRDVLVEGNRIAQRPGAGLANAINFSSTDTLPPIVGVTIRGNRIGPVPGGGDAIQAKHTRRLVIEDNEFFDIKRPPTKPGELAAHSDVFQSIYGAVDLTIRRNFIHDIAAQGIFIQGFRGENPRPVVEDNVLVRFDAPWVPLTVSGTDMRVRRNTVQGTLRTGPGVETGDISGNIASTVLIEPTASPVEDYNLASRFTRSKGPHSIVGAATFRDPTTNDFRLAPDSPGAGTAAEGADIGARRADFSARP